jgi:hypothetical protein
MRVIESKVSGCAVGERTLVDRMRPGRPSISVFNPLFRDLRCRAAARSLLVYAVERVTI